MHICLRKIEEVSKNAYMNRKSKVTSLTYSGIVSQRPASVFLELVRTFTNLANLAGGLDSQ